MRVHFERDRNIENYRTNDGMVNFGLGGFLVALIIKEVSFEFICALICEAISWHIRQKESPKLYSLLPFLTFVD